MKLRLTTGLALVAAILLGAWGYGQRVEANRMQAALEAGYQREFYDLLNQTEQLQVVLGKSLVSGSPEHNIGQLAEVWFRANAAQTALSQLPLKTVNMSATRKFLTQLGDYAYRLAQANSRGTELSSAQWERLAAFERQVSRLASDLHAVQRRTADTNFRWARVAPNTPSASADSAPQAPQGTASATALTVNPMDGLAAADKRLQQFPALIYDGPFSDHLENRRPRGLTGPAVSQSEALERARRFMADDGRPLRSAGQPRTMSGLMPAFSFTLRNPNASGSILIDVSRQGGHVVRMLSDRPVRDARLKSDQALERAEAFLNRNGFPTMTPSFSLREDHSEVISFIYRHGDLLLYPDQVKVKVALDNGQILAFDATGFYTNHRLRDLPEPKLTAAKARSRVSRHLQVEGVRLALIPTDSGEELLAYEVRGRLGNSTYLVYINALTGAEENILKIVDTPNGRLVM